MKQGKQVNDKLQETCVIPLAVYGHSKYCVIMRYKIIEVCLFASNVEELIYVIFTQNSVKTSILKGNTSGLFY